eukprot:881020-Pelagomonas_calceolata.AAC.13
MAAERHTAGTWSASDFACGQAVATKRAAAVQGTSPLQTTNMQGTHAHTSQGRWLSSTLCCPRYQPATENQHARHTHARTSQGCWLPVHLKLR